MMVKIWRGFGKPGHYRVSQTPAAFITGMPKSGTTAVVRLMGLCAGAESVSDPFHILDQRGIKYRDNLFAGRMSCVRLMRRHRTVFRGALVKDPNLIFFFNEVRTAYPGATWIATVRDPRDNIRSILNRLGLPGRSELLKDLPSDLGETWRRVLEGRTPSLPGGTVIERLAARWVAVANVYRQAATSMVLSRYEDFVVDKEVVIQSLCRAAGLEPVKSISEYVDRQFQPAGDRSVSWQEFFSPQDLASIDGICGNLLPAFGYRQSSAA